MPIISSSQRPDTLQIALITVLTCISITTSFFFNGREIDMYAISGIAATIALLVTLLSRTTQKLAVGPLGAILALYFTWSAFAITWSQAPYISVIELGTTGTALALFFVWRTLPLEYARYALGLILIALGFTFAAVLLTQYAIGAVPRVTFPNPNSAAGFMNLLWPTAAIGWLHTTHSHHKRVVYLALALLLVLAIGVQGSRGALIGSLVGLTVIVYVGITVLKRPRQSLSFAATFIGTLMIANLIGDHALQAQMGSIAEPALSGASRFTIWTATWDMIQDRPWLGFGPGVFWLAYPAYRFASDGSAGMFAHNDYLEFWLETGIPGLLLIAMLGIACMYTFRHSIKKYRSNEINEHAFLSVTASIVALAAVAVHSGFTYNLQMMPFALMVAVLIAHMESDSGIPNLLRFPLRSVNRRLLPMISIIALSLIPVGHFIRTAAAFAEIEDGSRHLGSDDYDAAAASFSTASAIWSQVDTPWYMHANTLLEGLRANRDFPASKKKELIVRAQGLLDEAEKRNPWRANTALVRGLLRADHPEWTNGNAEEAFRKAVALDPRNIEARYALSQVLQRDGETKEALDVIKVGLMINFGDHVDTMPLDRRAEELRRAISGASKTSPKSKSGFHSIEPGEIRVDERAKQQ